MPKVVEEENELITVAKMIGEWTKVAAGAIEVLPTAVTMAGFYIVALLAASHGSGWAESSMTWLTDSFKWIPGRDAAFALAFGCNVVVGTAVLVAVMLYASKMLPFCVILGVLFAAAGIVASVGMEWVVSFSDTPEFAEQEKQPEHTKKRRVYLHGVMGAATALMILAMPMVRPPNLDAAA